jgi:predicted membrane-bound spermidine synthase
MVLPNRNSPPLSRTSGKPVPGLEGPGGHGQEPLSRGADAEGRVISRRLAPLFFVSGMAALIYQVCWQRLLFSTFGVDLDSITIIVSVFMLGLGLGALLGGQLADWRPQFALPLFALAEFGIGLFGWFSPDLIRTTGDLFVGASQWGIGLINFLLLLIPTSLMGATLPILVAHATRIWGNVGRSIGILYQVNTFGAAFGVLIIGFLWFLLFEIDTAIRLAAVLNLLVSLLTFLWVQRHG